MTLQLPHFDKQLGARHLYEKEQLLPLDERYVQLVTEVPSQGDPDRDDDDADQYKIAICMTAEMARNFTRAHYCQGDISFKRYADGYEFEIGCWNSYTQIGMSHNGLNSCISSDTGFKRRSMHGFS